MLLHVFSDIPLATTICTGGNMTKRLKQYIPRFLNLQGKTFEGINFDIFILYRKRMSSRNLG